MIRRLITLLLVLLLPVHALAAVIGCCPVATSSAPDSAISSTIPDLAALPCHGGDQAPHPAPEGEGAHDHPSGSGSHGCCTVTLPAPSLLGAAPAPADAHRDDPATAFDSAELRPPKRPPRSTA